MHRDRELKIVCAALAVALVAALVGVALLWRERTADGDQEAAGAAAEKAARSAVAEMTTYDYRTVADDFAWVDDAGTERFQAFFGRVSKSAISFIKSVKASATGEVVDSAAAFVDDEHVRVLLFVDQKITSQGSKGAKLDQPRVTMNMVLQDGHWLVDEMQVNDVLTD
jgi:Mce-associated membrane protein